MAKFAITYENETIKYELTFRDKVYDFGTRLCNRIYRLYKNGLW